MRPARLARGSPRVSAGDFDLHEENFFFYFYFFYFYWYFYW